MKLTNFMLKLIAVCLAIATVSCFIIAYWDKIIDGLDSLRDKMEEQCSAHHHFKESEDWDD